MLTKASSSSNVNVGPQVFINFRGEELRSTFVTNLHQALSQGGINSFIDSDMISGQKLVTLFQKIEESGIALAILSSRYTESQWCLDELVKIKECSTKGEGCKNLLVIPIFYKIDSSIVRGLEGEFGIKLFNTWRMRSCDRDDRIVQWNAALQDVLSNAGLVFKENGPKSQEGETTLITNKPRNIFTIGTNNTEQEDQSLVGLETKLNIDFNDNETRIVGIVGMPGIGKTYLSEKLFVKLKRKINHCVIIGFEREKSKEQRSEWLQKRLVEALLEDDDCENWRNRASVFKVVVILDNVIDRGQIDEVLTKNDWIKKGSKIVITTRDKSVIDGLVFDLYEVPGLNERDGLYLCGNLKGSFMEIFWKLLTFVGGNPLALKEYVKELKGLDEDECEARLRTLTQVSNVEIRRVLRDFYENDLDEKQKDAFLDIVCFFRSENESYVTSLLDSIEAVREVKDLVDKFLIHISEGRVEMHNLLFTMGKELVETSTRKYWVLSSNHELSMNALRKKKGREEVRGVVIDMSKMEEMPLSNQIFVGMSNLRYIKVYNSQSHDLFETNCKLNLPDGIEFPKDNILRCLHWVNFLGEELPSDFEPNNLIDLWMPYNNITRLWDCDKVALKLKWVNLSHSSKLTSISGLSDAPNLLRLNLEGCTSLNDLPQEIMQKMKKLVFLNLRGCTSLLSLPKITMDSLKTLILSGCSNFQIFEVISKNLEKLHLNGTAISGLPQAIGNLHRLTLLSLKDCKNLVTIPDCLGKLKALEQLHLSRCAKLLSFVIHDKDFVKLRILLFDETSIADMPSNIIYSSWLQRLCLSRNNKIRNIDFDMGKLYNLEWLELKHCNNLTSLSTLPPNLHSLIAHGCISLRTIANPVARLKHSAQVHSSFDFTNCHKLEQTSKNAIISYFHKKCALMSDDGYNQDFVFKSLISTCFPGYEIPSCFNHQVLGSHLKVKLPRDWNANKFIAMALCVVVSFKDYKVKNNNLQVKCICEFNNSSLNPESIIIGDWSKPCNEPHRVVTDHIFVGYTKVLNIKKGKIIPPAFEASLKFEVTNGTSLAEECKVMKCGFSWVYELDDDDDNTSREETPGMENNGLDQRSSFTIADDSPSVTPRTPGPIMTKLWNYYTLKSD
ncbi:unnamed protein product [Cochlearia groenlandica]